MFDFFKAAGAGHQNLTPAQFAEGLRQPGGILLDVRRPEEFVQGHLPGALNFEVTAPGFVQQVAGLDKTAVIHVYCRSGARSANAAEQLTRAGFAHVTNLLGGVLDWPEPLTTH